MWCRYLSKCCKTQVFCTFWRVLYILTDKCAWRHSRVQFFDIEPSKSGPNPPVFLAFWLRNGLRATAACHFSRSQLPKWLRSWGVLYILTYKCASRHSGVPFFQIETCKMAPTLRRFVHFDVEMCFAPQRRAIFPDRDLQNGSDTEEFCTFWRRNVLRATAACNFSYLFSAAPSAPAALTSLLCRR